jgi:hypothetical protein
MISLTDKRSASRMNSCFSESDIPVSSACEIVKFFFHVGLIGSTESHDTIQKKENNTNKDFFVFINNYTQLLDFVTAYPKNQKATALPYLEC